MGPEATPVCFLKQAMTCIQRAIVGLSVKNSPDSNGDIKSEEPILDDNEVIGKLTEITGTLERCMEAHKTVHELMTAKMKCTTCGATSVGFDCHNGASSTPTQRSSEERRKVSEEEDEEVDEKCSSIGSQRIASVDSSSSVDAFENPIRSVSSSISAPADEEETILAVNTDAGDDHDLVMKSILKTVNAEVKEEQVATTAPPDTSMLDQFLQSSLLGLAPEVGKIETPSVEENEEDKEQNNALLSSFFQVLFQNQSTSLLDSVSTSSENGTETSQLSPPDTTLDTSLALIESLLAESVANADATSAEAKAAARKRKSTPMKVPKTENGAGYVCPMEGCNKVFKEKGSVHRHFVTHIGMRFNCDKCKASYTQKHALMLHQKIHSNPDAYQCRGCGTNYTTQNGLRLHRQRNPTCMELANAMEFNAKNATPTKHMVSAP